MADTDPAQSQQRGLRPWRPGQSGNPKGREKGSRNKLGEEFIKDVLADWQEHGAQAVKDTREKDPVAYVRVVASILPRDINFRVGDLEDLSDDELAGELAAIAAQLTGEGGGAFARIAQALGCEGGESKPH